MKFAKTLQSEIILEWSTKYIDYKGLKAKLRAVERARHSHENRFSSTTFGSGRNYTINDRYPNGIHHNRHPNGPEYFTSTRPHGLSLNPAHRAMSVTSMAESTGSLLSKVSSILTNWMKNTADFALPEHDPTPIIITSFESLMLNSNKYERDFFRMVDRELEKVNGFYEFQENEWMDQFEIIKQQHSQNKLSRPRNIMTDGLQIGSPDERQQNEAKYKDGKKLVKKALFEIYRGTELLRKYRSLNQVAFSKVLKKYDTITNVNVSKLYMSRVNSKNFVRSKKLGKLIKEIENFFATNFGESSRKRSIKELRVPNKKNVRHYSSIWKTGIYLGMALPVFIHSVYLALSNNKEMFLRDAHDIDNGDYYSVTSQVMILYSGIGIPVILMLLFGANMYVWTRARINYKFIFEFDPRDNIDYHQYMEIPSLIFLALSFFMYITIENTFGIYQEDYPKILLTFILVIVFMPYRAFYYNARRWFILTIARIFASPFTSVGFREFFVADELNSLSYSFTTLQLLLCTCANADSCSRQCYLSKSYYTPILASIPPMLRLLQSLRRYRDTDKLIHLVNVGKYLSSVVVVCIFYWHRTTSDPRVKIFWIISQSVNSIYTFSWDVKMDWRLFQSSSNILLRDHLEYRRKWVYYCGIVINLLLRCSWVLVLFRDSLTEGLVIAFGESVRRWIWNFFRVENDHSNNCFKSRAIGIDKIIDKLMGKPIIDEKDLDLDLADSSIRVSTIYEDDRFRDFERNDRVYSDEDYDYYDDDEEDDSTDKDDFAPKRYLMGVDPSVNNRIPYASRRLPISMADIAEVLEGDGIDFI